MRNSSPVEPIIPVFKKEEIPSHWDLVSIGDICATVDKVNPKDNPTDGFKYIDISGIDNERFMVAETKAYYGNNAPSRARQLVREGDVVFSTVRTYLKNMARITRELDGEVASTGFCVLRPKEPEYSGYLFYYLQYEPFLNELAKFQRGTSYPAVRDGDIFAQFIPVPSKPEAVRIVAEVEKQFSRLDDAVANLKRVKANLKRYKAAVLKAAVEGKLTEEWRKQKPLDLADGLLDKIWVEKQKYFEKQREELAKMINSIRVPHEEAQSRPKPRKPQKATSMTEGELSELPLIPKGWCWTRLQNAILEIVVGYVGPIKEYFDEKSNIRLLSTTHIGENEFINYEIRYVSRKFDIKNRKSSVSPGDILIARHGDSGKACLVPSYVEKAQVSNAVIIRPIKKLMNPLYLSYAINATRKELQRRRVGGLQQVVNTQSMSDFPIPIPTLDEQNEIVKEIETRLTLEKALSDQVEGDIKRANRLRQAILNKAFVGNLA